MTEDLTEKLKSEIDTTAWNELAPHEARQALIMIDPTLDLVTVAMRIAQDEVEAVKEWMDQNLIQRPSEQQKKGFEANPHSKQFRFLIVQPYVLAQLL